MNLQILLMKHSIDIGVVIGFIYRSFISEEFPGTVLKATILRNRSFRNDLSISRIKTFLFISVLSVNNLLFTGNMAWSYGNAVNVWPKTNYDG